LKQRSLNIPALVHCHGQSCASAISTAPSLALSSRLPNGLEGAKVTRIRTLARYIDGVNFPGGTNPLGTPDPTAEFPREIYYIDRKASENRDLIEFELAAAFDLVGVRAPKRQCVSNVCQWTYRGAECGYAGNAYFNFNDVPVGAIGQDVCGKRLRSCELRFSQQRFAGPSQLAAT
jgi:lambda family phage minor tail protein L